MQDYSQVCYTYWSRAGTLAREYPNLLRHYSLKQSRQRTSLSTDSSVVKNQSGDTFGAKIRHIVGRNQHRLERYRTMTVLSQHNTVVNARHPQTV